MRVQPWFGVDLSKEESVFVLFQRKVIFFQKKRVLFTIMLFQEQFFVGNTSTIHGRFIEFKGTLHKEAFFVGNTSTIHRRFVNDSQKIRSLLPNRRRESTRTRSLQVRCILSVPIKQARHESGTAFVRRCSQISQIRSFQCVLLQSRSKVILVWKSRNSRVCEGLCGFGFIT